MPWNETEPMNERVKFIAEWLRHEESLTTLCKDAGISRKTGYKWIDRYEQGGVAFERTYPNGGADWWVG
jgi:transposase